MCEDCKKEIEKLISIYRENQLAVIKKLEECDNTIDNVHLTGLGLTYLNVIKDLEELIK